MQRLGARMHDRKLLVAPFRPGVVRESDGIFVAIDLHPLFHAVVLILEPGEPARIAGPHVPFRGAFSHPFRQNLARPARLADAKGEDAGLEGIGHTRHRPDQGVAIRGIGDRPVDHLGQRRLFQQRHAGHRIGDIPFQPLQIVGEQLEAEILRKGIVLGHPMRAAVPLIGSKIEAHLFLPQVIAAVDVAQERQLVAHLGGPLRQFGNGVEQHVLMAHHHHRHVAAEPFADLARIVAGGIDHDLAADVALWGLDDPLVPLAPHAGGGAEALDPRAQRPRALGQGLGELRRIDVAVIGVVQSPAEVVSFQEGVARAHLIRPQDVQVHALIATHARDALKLAQPLGAVPQPDRAGDMVVHRVVDGVAKAPIKLRRIALHVHDRPAGGKGRHIACRMPGGPCGQLVLLQQDGIGPSGFRQMIQRRCPHRAAANDHNPRACRKFRHAPSPLFRRRSIGWAQGAFNSPSSVLLIG